jgi:hypothetical protein
MIKVTLEIDNHTAHSCSPLKFLQTKILQDATETEKSKNCEGYAQYNTPYANILVSSIEQL